MRIARSMGRAQALILIAEGLITVVRGRGFLVWQRRVAPDWYKSVLNWLLGWPELLLSLGAAVEIALGGPLLRQTERRDDAA